jgi:hypothetical protein
MGLAGYQKRPGEEENVSRKMTDQSVTRRPNDIKAGVSSIYCNKKGEKIVGL